LPVSFTKGAIDCPKFCGAKLKNQVLQRQNLLTSPSYITQGDVTLSGNAKLGFALQNLGCWFFFFFTKKKLRKQVSLLANRAKHARAKRMIVTDAPSYIRDKRIP